MPDDDPSASHLLDVLRDRQRSAWKRGERLPVEALISNVAQSLAESDHLELIYAEVMLRTELNETCQLDEFTERFPKFVVALRRLFAVHQLLEAPSTAAAEFVEQQFRHSATPSNRRGSDRNLLFGILALQMDFITRDALVEALREWTTQKDKPLGQILVERGDLSASHRELLEPLVDEHVLRHDGDPAASLASVSSLNEPTIDWHRVHDVDVAESLAARQLARKSAGSVRRGATASESTARFRVLRPHARGGIGEVFLAFDQELNREVALKEIQSRHLGDESYRERFVREAEVTGGLEHPGIVPVYSLGHHGDGRPFYAMRFIRGDSLKEAIEQFHSGARLPPAEAPARSSAVNLSQVATVIGPDPALTSDTTKSPGVDQCAKREHFASIEFRKLLGRFIDVCQAIEYAHSRGVLHRDLKPGNIMLGKYGETLVVDWGLAKAAGKVDRFAESDEATLIPSSSGSSIEPTRMGSAIGTPGYMSPEQAAGRLDQLGPATDVYALGATLYHVLTGHSPMTAPSRDAGAAHAPAFKRNSLPEILQRIQQGDYLRPHEVNSQIPRPLEAICLKAMALSPQDRYLSPSGLAEDVEHWLADEPVAAHADSVSARVARWSRKHRGLVQAGSAAMLVLLIVTIIAALLIDAQRRQTAKLAREKGILADDMSKLASEKSTLADTNAQLFKAERVAKTEAQANQKLAVMRADSLKRAFARSLFDHGLGEYEDGRLSNTYADLTRAVVMTTRDDPLLGTYRRLLVDRVTQGGRQLVPPLQHAGWVNSVAFSPDGARIVTGSADGTARLWDESTGRPIGEPLNHDDEIAAVAFNPDGTRIVTGSRDGSARLWDGSTGRPIAKPMRHENSILSVAFSPDGLRIVTGSIDGTARLWNGSTGEPLSGPMRHDGYLYCASFSPDGTRVLTGSGDKTARLWDGNTGRPLGEPLRHGGEVWCAAFSPDGRRIVTGSSDLSARLWDGTSGQPLGEPMRHDDLVADVAFSPDGMRVVTGSGDKTARLWNGTTGQPLGQPMLHDGAVLTVAFSPDGTRVVTGGHDRTVRLWDGTTGRSLGEPMHHEGWVSNVLFSPSGTQVVSASRDNTARLWDGLTGQPLGAPMRHDRDIVSVAFSKDGERVVTGSRDKTARLWNGHNGQPVGAPMRHDDNVVSVACSPDGLRVVSGSDDATARLWDSTTGLSLGETMRHRQYVADVAFSPDGERVLTGSDDRTARLWDGTNGRPLGEPMQHHGSVTRVIFSPDGARIVTGGGDARIWEIKTGKPLGEPMESDFGMNCMAFSPDGTRVVTGSNDKTARLWDGTTGRPLGEPMRHSHWVTCVEFSPDGTRVVTGSRDQTARLWDGTTGKPLGEPMRHEGEVGAVTFSADGTRVLSASGDSTARQWDGITGWSIGVPLRHEGGVSKAAFSSDDARIVTVSHESAQLWDVSLPRSDEPSVQKQVQSLALWTGVQQDAEGSIQSASFRDLEQLRTAPLSDETLAKLQFERQLRRRDAHHLGMAAKAEHGERWFSAVFHLREIARFRPDDPVFVNRLDFAAGSWAAESGHYAEAVRHFSQLCERDPSHAPGARAYATACLGMGDRDRFLSAWKALYTQFKESTGEEEMRTVLMIYLTGAPAPKEADGLRRMAELFARDHPGRRWIVGAVNIRCEQYTLGIDELAKSINDTPPGFWQLLILALGEVKNGNVDAATVSYQQAESLIEQTNRQGIWKWEARIQATVLQREVAAMLKAKIVHAPEGAELIPVLPLVETRKR